MTKSYKTIWKDGKQQRLHRVIMEEHLGRKLTRNELVHHIDGNIFNNHISNLKIITRAFHMKYHKIGEKTRFKKTYNFNINDILEHYKTKTIMQIAEIYGCSYGPIQRFIKENNIRQKIICSVCGDFANVRRQQLCTKHYQEKWRRKQKIKL